MKNKESWIIKVYANALFIIFTEHSHDESMIQTSKQTLVSYKPSTLQAQTHVIPRRNLFISFFFFFLLLED